MGSFGRGSGPSPLSSSPGPRVVAGGGGRSGRRGRSARAARARRRRGSGRAGPRRGRGRRTGCGDGGAGARAGRPRGCRRGSPRSRSFQAAWAAAARAVTMSARIPSTSKAAHTSAILSRAASVSRTRADQRLGGEDALGEQLLRLGVLRGERRPGRCRRPSDAVRPRRAVPGSRGAATSTVRPNRSSSWGRSSPSSGFIVPTRTNRAACSTETPSRSTVERPIAAASRSRSTRWSWSRFTSSTYRIPRWARASRPGSYSVRALRQRTLEVQRAEHPVLGGADRQLDEPHRPRLGGGVRVEGPSGRERVGSRGSLENRSPAITSMGGSTAARARTIVDFAVPFSPRTSTPPTSGEIVVRIRASAMSSEPTTA